MRGLDGLMFLAALAAPAAGAAAQVPSGGIDCIYSRLPAAEATALGKGYATDSIPVAQIAERLKPLVQACADSGALTSQGQVQPAFEYTLLRLEGDQDAAFLRANGVDPAKIRGLYAKLDPPMIALLEKAALSEAEKDRLTLYLVKTLSRDPTLKAPLRARASLLLYNVGKMRVRQAAFAAAR
ncbi:MAG TPA: hypothetical protein VE053_11905 [Allosphingosinicella sp.]|nr:hypothetical protein [Allosphingosinicella sp.]